MRICTTKKERRKEKNFSLLFFDIFFFLIFFSLNANKLDRNKEIKTPNEFSKMIEKDMYSDKPSSYLTPSSTILRAFIQDLNAFPRNDPGRLVIL